MRHALPFTLCLAAIGCQSAYYQPCASSDECDDLGCEDPGGFRAVELERFCTARCLSSADCVARFGAGSYCGVSEICFHACAVDEDCPSDATCHPVGVCAHVRDVR